MRKITLLVAACLPLVFFSCKEKKDSTVIITKKIEKPAIPSGPLAMSDYSWSKEIEWVGSTYTVAIKRYADKELPLAKDEAGRSYYDNRIHVKIIRKDGSTFFDRVFTKKDFSAFADNEYGRTGALLGIVFDKVEEGHLSFAGSVGSPDTMSDEYIPLLVEISRQGNVSIKNDTQLDTGNPNAGDEDKSAADRQLEAAEAEGM